MKEYIKYFENADSADEYDINNIPFICSIKYNKKLRNLRTRKEDKYLKKLNDGSVIIDERLAFVSSGSSTIGLAKKSTHHTVEYSKDKITWNELTTAITINLVNSERVYVRGILASAQTDTDYTQFKMSGSIAAKGNCNCLWNYLDPKQPLRKYCGRRMFMGCTGLLTVPDLPSKILSEYCYDNMFRGCSNLTTVPASFLAAEHLEPYCYRSMFYDCINLVNTPELHTTTLADYCYAWMFSKCTNLTAAPELPATTLADYCYCCMFQYCASLIAVTALPATTLADSCYRYMFQYCASLTEAPELPATTLASNCYYAMFYNCSRLNYIKCLAVNGINQNSSTSYWVQGVANSGTFVKHPDVDENTWGRGVSGIPNNWAVQDAT